MNTLDKQYQELLQTILDYGVEKKDRTGTGTKSIFGYTIRHNMSEGFPVLTTKKMAWNPDVAVFDQQDMRPEDFRVDGYESHPTIKFPLSN